MDIEYTELQEWELLHPNSPFDPELDLNSAKKHNTFVEIGHETDALIQTNYFSMTTPFHAYGVEKGSEESDNSGEFRSDDHQLERVIDVGMLDNPKGQLGLGGIDEMGGENEVKLRELEVGVVENSKLQVGFGEIKEMESEGKAHMGVVQNSIMEVDFREIDDIGSETGTEFLPDSGGVELGGVKFGDVEEMSESCVEEKEENETVEGEKTDGTVGVEVSKAGEQKSSVVWWKAPLEILKCCASRIRPVWAFSVAAAVMGFVILGRRLYKMKKKTKGLELKVAVDDKKVSQFMSRAARLSIFCCEAGSCDSTSAARNWSFSMACR